MLKLKILLFCSEFLIKQNDGKKNNNEKKIILCSESSGIIQLQEDRDFFVSSPTPFPCLFETLEEVCWDPKNTSNILILKVLTSCLRE